MKPTNGIILINKPSNYTSRDIVNILCKKLGTKKVGHTGTLDPLASGLLVICFGKYTKLVNAITNATKTYIAEIKLGLRTDTLDITGNILETKPFNVTKEEIIQVLSSFKGVYHMEVPIYSAIKVNGQKLYEYARKKKEVSLPKKDVHIYDIKLLDFKDDLIKFEVTVEKGTYIRSLIRDISLKLNTVGTMYSLVRTSQGKFSLADAYTLEDIANNNYKILDILDVLEDIAPYKLNESEYLKVKNGNIVPLSSTYNYLYLIYQKTPIAIYQNQDNLYKAFIMLI